MKTTYMTRQAAEILANHVLRMDRLDPVRIVVTKLIERWDAAPENYVGRDTVLDWVSAGCDVEDELCSFFAIDDEEVDEHRLENLMETP